MDDIALKKLLNAYWSSQGWKNGKISQEDFNYCKDKGIMFDPLLISHNEAIERLKKVVESISKEQVVNAFLVSLSSRRLELRSALGSFVLAKSIPNHKNAKYLCKICNFVNGNKSEDLNVLNFERYKWGGIRHGQVIYALFDLEQFLKIKDIPQASNTDKQIFQDIINVIKSLDNNSTPRVIEKRISNVLKSNKAEREVLINILGICSILETNEHKGIASRYIDVSQTDSPTHKNDWGYPVAYWRGIDGVNIQMILEFFPFVINDKKD